jgi:CII-binding regulator of phage lambda lysogenization HflD
MSSNSSTVETQLAVLEEITAGHERRMIQFESYQQELVDRFDQKNLQDNIDRVQIERALIKATTVLESLSDTLKKIVPIAERAEALANQHETMMRTIAKIIAALVPLVAAAWAVFTYVSK